MTRGCLLSARPCKPIKPTGPDALIGFSANMNATYTLNSKVFNKTGNLGSTGVVLTTRDRGVGLPDTLSVQHKRTANTVEAGTFDKRSNVKFTRTYVSGDFTKEIAFQIGAIIPDDADATNVAACLDDMMAWLTSARTLTAANIAVITNGEVA